MQTRLKLIRTGYRSLSITVPADFVRAYGLSAGDVVEWESAETIAVLKFFKVTRTETPLVNQLAQDAPVEEETSVPAA
jgi:Antidote-toxin recognition MazE, bacterial antitoxin